MLPEPLSSAPRPYSARTASAVLAVFSPLSLVCLLLFLSAPKATATDPNVSVGLWTVYTSTNSGLPSNPRVRALDVDTLSRLWVGTAANGLRFFDGNEPPFDADELDEFGDFEDEG